MNWPRTYERFLAVKRRYLDGVDLAWERQDRPAITCYEMLLACMNVMENSYKLGDRTASLYSAMAGVEN
jgi:hypothetical protein